MDNDILYLIKQISDKYQTRRDNQLKERNLTFSQLRLIITVDRAGGKIFQKKLEEELHVSHATIVGLVKRLQKNDYVYTETDENDRRNTIVCVGPEAFRFRDELIYDIRTYREGMMEGISTEQLNEATAVLRKLNSNIDKMKG